MIFAVFDPSPLTVCINCSFFTFIDCINEARVSQSSDAMRVKVLFPSRQSTCCFVWKWHDSYHRSCRNRKAASTPAAVSKQHCRMLQVERFFRQCRNKLNMFVSTSSKGACTNIFTTNIHICPANNQQVGM